MKDKLTVVPITIKEVPRNIFRTLENEWDSLQKNPNLIIYKLIDPQKDNEIDKIIAIITEDGKGTGRIVHPRNGLPPEESPKGTVIFKLIREYEQPH